MRALTKADVRFTVEIEPEDMPIEGNAMASGDDAVDQECYDWIRSELDRGNDAAWCCAHVRATWEGFHGDAYLGGCSYRSERELWEHNCDAMKQEALDALNERVRSALSSLEALSSEVK